MLGCKGVGICLYLILSKVQRFAELQITLSDPGGYSSAKVYKSP